MLRRPTLVLLTAAVGLALIVVGTLVRVRLAASSSRLPDRGEERVELAGLDGPVSVLLDGSGVPHVEASTAGDLWFVEGYLHARDRFFQMELNRRAASGRLSEVFGSAMLPADRRLRTLRLAATARRQATELTVPERRVLEPYAAGVNAALAAHGRWIAPELGLLGIVPERWQVEDTLALGMLFQLGVTTAMGEELERARELERLGRERAVELWGWSPEQAERWIPAETGAPPTPAEEIPGLPALGGVGSNNWAIAPHRTATGRPLLASDPHLGVVMPGSWYAVHLRGAGLDVAGASLPGAPGVMIGHNQRVAWGFTMVMLDDQDLYRVRLAPEGQREHVEGEWRRLHVVEEPIVVRWQEQPEILQVRVAAAGPIVRDTPDGPLALAWTALTGRTPVGAFVRMMRAGSVTELVGAWDGVLGPSMHLAAADVDGRILHQVVGLVPVRGRGAGRLPAPADDPEWAWQGFRSVSSALRRLDPPEGFVASANHDPFTEGDFPGADAFPGEFASPWRVRRIRERLAAREDWDVADCLALQGDVVSLRARALVGLLRPDLERSASRTARELLAWDGSMGRGDVRAQRYARFLLELGALLERPAAGDDPERAPLLGPERLLRLAAGALDDGWWDLPATAVREDRTAALAAALARTDRVAGAHSWGEVHRVTFAHPLGGMPVVGPLLGRAWSRGPYPVGGDGSTVNAHYWSAGDPYTVEAIPSMRFVADVGAWDRSLLVLPVGQSGRPWSSHYDDQLAAWLEVQPVPLPYSPEAVVRAARSLLRLEPPAGSSARDDDPSAAVADPAGTVN